LNEGIPSGDPWAFRIHSRLWHMAEDADWFRTRTELERDGWKPSGSQFERKRDRMVPLFEAKMLHHFDHRYGTYEGQTEAQGNQGKLPELDDAGHADPTRSTTPNYWVPAEEAEKRLSALWTRGWILGWRNIARSTDQRTLISVLFPRAAAGNATPLAFPGASADAIAMLYANLCSFALDYCVRQKVGGTNVTYNYVRQFPVLAPRVYGAERPWADQSVATVASFVLPRVVELTFTAWDLEAFGTDVGFEGPPFRWDAARRPLLRAELDAAFFHLYGLSRDDTDYVLETFPIVRKNDEKKYGEYRTKRLILERYDALASASRTGDYKTPLDPPPAHDSMRHPPRAR
jgi:hypothetical protein